MLFDDKKLSTQSIEKLVQCPVHTVEPYSLMLAPVYVLMSLNQKLVSVKAPLDFFLPDEIEKLKRYETFYLSKTVESAVPFQTAARLVKNILCVDPIEMKPAPFEYSNETFSVMASLWGKELQVEPFFMSVFAHELCAPLSHEQIVEAREQAVVKHDLGLLLSGAFVFMAVQLGWFDFDLLTDARNEIYIRTASGEEWDAPTKEFEFIVQSLNEMLTHSRSISFLALEERDDEWAIKISARIKKFIAKRGIPKLHSASIYGEEGFAA